MINDEKNYEVTHGSFFGENIKRAIKTLKNGRLFRKHKYNTIDVEFPAGWSNCAVTVNNYFIADTNDSSNWDTIKFPLPKPKYKWQIRCYGDTLDRKNNKIFAVLIDM